MITVLSLIAAASIAQLVPPSHHADADWVERQTYVMGTVLTARVATASRDEGIAAIEAVFANTRRLEGVLSSWTHESDLGALNVARVGEPVALSRELASLLHEAGSWVNRTGGAFDPGVGALSDAWDLRGAGRVPEPDELAAARASTGMRHFEIESQLGTARRLDARAWLDSGGFGKGVALREAEEILRERGVATATLDFGGQLLFFGKPADGAAWDIGIAHPGARDRKQTEIRLSAGSVSTSAQSERFVDVAGQRYGHIVDPRSGIPVPPWGSVTVVAADAVTADVLSTALLVMGPVEGGKWAAELSDVGVLFLENQGGEIRASWNRAFEHLNQSENLR